MDPSVVTDRDIIPPYVGNGSSAGCTFRETENRESPTRHSWSFCDHSTFNLRIGPNYAQSLKKAPSPPAIMQIVAVDMMRCDSRIDNVAKNFALNPEWNDVETNHPGVPPIFVVNVQVPDTKSLLKSELYIFCIQQLPDNFSPSFFSTIDNGSGWSLVFYFLVTQVLTQIYLEIM